MGLEIFKTNVKTLQEADYVLRVLRRSVSDAEINLILRTPTEFLV